MLTFMLWRKDPNWIKKRTNAVVDCLIDRIKMSVEISSWDHIQCEKKFNFRKSNFIHEEVWLDFTNIYDWINIKQSHILIVFSFVFREKYYSSLFFFDFSEDEDGMMSLWL